MLFLATLLAQAQAAFYLIELATVDPQYFRHKGTMTYLKDGRLAYSVQGSQLELRVSIDENGHASVGGDSLGVSRDGFPVVNSDQNLDLKWSVFYDKDWADSFLSCNNISTFYICNTDAGVSYQPRRANDKFPIALKQGNSGPPEHCVNPMGLRLRATDEEVIYQNGVNVLRSMYSKLGYTKFPSAGTEAASTYLTGVYAGAESPHNSTSSSSEASITGSETASSGSASAAGTAVGSAPSTTTLASTHVSQSASNTTPTSLTSTTSSLSTPSASLSSSLTNMARSVGISAAYLLALII